MKILHVIPSLSPTQGGPSFALPLMERALVGSDLEMTVVTTDDDGPGRHAGVPLDQPVASHGATRIYFRKQTEFYKVSLPLGRWVNRHVADYDMVHIHALFSYTSVAAARAARRQGVPYIIRPLGVLNRWGMANRRRWWKSLSFRLIEQPILRYAAAMHYTSRAEQCEAEAAGATAPAAVIPLGLDIAEFQNLPGPDKFLDRFPAAHGKTIVLFLSRLDAKKGLDLLLEAWAQMRNQNTETLKLENRKSEIGNRKSPDWLLVIAGKGEPSFERNLREQAARLGLADQILWTGFLAGADKASALAATSVFVLPSYSENFGIALVEALAAGLPCVTTTGVAVSDDVQEREAGLVVPPEKTALADALVRLLADEALRTRLGANACRLAAERFTVQAMGAALQNLYMQILKGERIKTL